jgi:hypothetical protein
MHLRLHAKISCNKYHERPGSAVFVPKVTLTTPFRGLLPYIFAGLLPLPQLKVKLAIYLTIENRQTYLLHVMACADAQMHVVDLLRVTRSPHLYRCSANKPAKRERNHAALL